MIADFREAAKLLPVNWDDTDTGRPTKGNNIFRPNKIWALSYLGKAALHAGSPLMVNGTDNDLRTYDANYCKIAADALGEVISMVDKGQCQYKLVDFADYSKLFYERKDFLMPGSTEAIMRSPSFGADSYWRQMNSYQISAICNGDGIIICPTANYVNYYVMANGQPLYNEDGTVLYDPSDPDSNKPNIDDISDPGDYEDVDINVPIEVEEKEEDASGGSS